MSIINDLNQCDNQRNYLQVLKNRDDMLFIDEFNENPEAFLAYLDSEDVKVRKLMFELIASTEEVRYFDTLYMHYINETQQMIRGKLLKALAIYDLSSHIESLSAIEVKLLPLLEDETQSKNVREELKVLRKVLSTYVKKENHHFIGFKKPVSIVLTINAGHHDALMNELYFENMKKVGFGVQVKTNDLDALFQCRLWHQMYFPIVKLNELQFDEATSKTILKFLNCCHEKNDQSYRFRVDYEDGEISKKLASQLEQYTHSQLQNHIQDYEIEIRLRQVKSGYAVYLKLMTIEDPRFSYRKGISSSSISPSTAALMMYYLQDYISTVGDVFDPMCNDGVVLAERCMISEPHFALGLNMDESIHRKAKQNLSQFNNVHLVQRDLKTFTHKNKFTEIISKLPSLNNEKDTNALEHIYELYFKKIKEFAVEGTIIGLVTTEAKLLEQVSKNKGSYLKYRKRIALNTKLTLYIFEAYNI